MNSISILSTLAMAVGLAAALPQILQMVRTRSASGQSALGWGMGLVTNLSMAYVNEVGFGAKALMASNLLSGTLCLAAIALIGRFGAAADVASDVAAPAMPIAGRIHPRPVVVPLAPEHQGSLVEMPTTEFAALRDAILLVDEARGRRGAEGLHGDRDALLAAA
ncbi:MAG: hypothetical protein AAGC46_16890 [Solirubrobacteraceae bacterium]